MVVAKENEIYKIEPNSDIEIIKLYVDEQSGAGRFKVSFELYEDEYFSTKVTSAPFLTVGDFLRLNVVLQEPVEGAKLQVEDCWATPSPKADHPDAFLIIDQYCPTYLGRQVGTAFIENGNSTGKFFISIF
jgi:hypothetical protein